MSNLNPETAWCMQMGCRSQRLGDGEEAVPSIRMRVTDLSLFYRILKTLGWQDACRWAAARSWATAKGRSPLWTQGWMTTPCMHPKPWTLMWHGACRWAAARSWGDGKGAAPFSDTTVDNHSLYIP